MGLSAPASSARSDAALAAGLFLAALLLQLAIFDRGAFYTDEGLVAQTAAEINRGRVPYRDMVMPLPGPAAFYLLAGVAFLAKQDLGGAGALGLGVALLLLARERRFVTGAAFAAGLCAVLLPTLASFAAAGALPSLYDQAVRTAFRGLVEFDYLRL